MRPAGPPTFEKTVQCYNKPDQRSCEQAECSWSSGACKLLYNAIAIAKAIEKDQATSYSCDGIKTQVGDEQRCLKPKDAFKDCPECPEMVVVPAGEFIM